MLFFVEKILGGYNALRTYYINGIFIVGSLFLFILKLQKKSQQGGVYHYSLLRNKFMFCVF
jgi:hypothetical protein